jgi:hypothetical protein
MRADRACATLAPDRIGSPLAIQNSGVRGIVPDGVEEEALDLRRGGTLPAPLLRRLDELAAREATAFNQLLADLSRGRERNIDWWVSRPATRNNHISAFYEQCIQLALVRQLLDEGRRVVVTVDAPEMAETLRHGGDPRLRVVLTGKWRTWLRRLRQALWDIASSVLHCAGAALAARLTRPYARPLPAGPLIVIDMFVLRDAIVEDEFRDRYYPGLLDMMAAEDRARTCYLPVFYRQRHYLSTFRALRKGRANFIFREDHLGFGDYAFAFGHWLRVGGLLGSQGHFAGFEVGALVDADLRSGRFAAIVVRSLLAYRFLLAARRRGIRIRSILDWYEGLDFNHAIAAAVNWHWPEVQLIGFRSVGSAFYMSAIPAPHEVAAGVVPQTLAVVGTRNAEDIRAACPALRVVTGTGFRYRQFHAMRRQRQDSGKAVLLALPLSPALARDAIATLASARRLMTGAPAHWWIKCHPALPQAELLAALDGGLPEGLRFVEGDFHDWLVRADVVAGVASSTLTEAVALGIPAICLAAGNAPTEIPVPSWVDRRLSYVAYDARETAEAIAAAISGPAFAVDCAALQEALLSPEAMDLIQRLLAPHVPEPHV